jgi:hypothetical protein
LLGVTLTALAILYRVLGGPALHRMAWTILALSTLAALLAVVLYYGHFADVYRDALRVRATTATVDQAPAGNGVAVRGSGVAPSASLLSRTRNALTFAVAMIGWPVVLLGILGAWRLWLDRARDRATLAILSWTIACLAFLAVAVMRVDAPFQRYAAEFFGRVLLATFPAAVLLAARGAGWAWRHRLSTRMVSGLLLVCAVAVGVHAWLVWFY